MAYEFRLPDLGEGMAEATIVKWLVKPGDYVRKDQPILQVETDKAIVDIPSPYEGKVLSLKFNEGDTARVGSVLLTIGGESAEVEEHKTGVGTVIGAGVPVQAPVAAPRVRKLARELGVDISTIKGSGAHGEATEEDVRAAASQKRPLIKEIGLAGEVRIVERAGAVPRTVRAVPKARELAKSLGIDISSVVGTGPDGIITVSDVERHSHATERIVEVGKLAKGEGAGSALEKVRHPLKEEAGKLIEERVPVKGVRKAIITKLTKSNTLAVQATAHEEIDVTRLVEIRSKQKIDAEKRGIKLTYLPFIIKACVIALRRNPWLNASLDDESNEFVLKRYYNIGIAVNTDDGLIVPVVKDVDLKSILDIAREIEQLAQRARERKLALDEVSGGTFTISNWGSIGGTYGTPVLNYPECAILGTGRIYKKPVVVGDRVEIRWVMPVSLTFDHRIVDGAQAAAFLMDIKRHLEDPSLLLVEII
ncbi:MAG: 2-oxo acid dehydrogenase subunit E2 [Candidatus Micrarchaeota archaeon]|nr:2-oxo acid dehydrogenase subunit E2 [Candidatus Micrarchaeota archaeon]